MGKAYALPNLRLSLTEPYWDIDSDEFVDHWIIRNLLVITRYPVASETVEISSERIDDIPLISSPFAKYYTAMVLGSPQSP